MREIKFRAWDKTINRMWSWGGSGLVENWLKHPNIYILLQYIGLRDKNGVEICEGDILHDHILSLDKDRYVQVVWDIYGARFVTHSITDGINGVEDNIVEDDLLVKRGDLCSVIGNIYENPELLKAKS